MNKQQLVASVSDKTKYTKKAIEEVLDAMLETVSDELKKKEIVRLVGFGTLSVEKRAARKCVNPATKKMMKVPAKNKVKFRAGKALSDAVNKKK